MCKPQEISNWLRSVYRISAGKWIPGRNKKPPLFCRFLRNWRYLNMNKNRRSSWGFCKIFENFLYLQILLLSQFSDVAFFSFFFTSFFFMFFYHTFWHFTLFFLFLPPVNLNAKFWNLWSAKGSEKDKAFYAHFLPIQMVTSHSRDLWCMFLFGQNGYLPIKY